MKYSQRLHGNTHTHTETDYYNLHAQVNNYGVGIDFVANVISLLIEDPWIESH